MKIKTDMIPELDVWEKQLRPGHWVEGKSAWAVARSWNDAKGLPSEICRVLGRNSRLIRMEPECAVALPGFSGPSWCDVFARVDLGGKEYVLVVEAKKDENFGQKIGGWLNRKGSDDSERNRKYRLTEICKKFGFEDDLVPDKNLRYELFHKAYASLKCAEFWNVEGAIMLVQSFSENRAKPAGLKEFRDFCGLFERIFEFPEGPCEEFREPVDSGTTISPDILYGIQTLSDTPLFLGWVTCKMPEEE